MQLNSDDVNHEKVKGLISVYLAPFLKIPTVKSLEVLYPLIFLLFSESTPSPSPLHSYNLWVNLPCCASPLKAFDLDLVFYPEPIDIQKNISFFCAHFSVSLVAMQEETQNDYIHPIHQLTTQQLQY